MAGSRPGPQPVIEPDVLRGGGASVHAARPFFPFCRSRLRQCFRCLLPVDEVGITILVHEAIPSSLCSRWILNHYVSLAGVRESGVGPTSLHLVCARGKTICEAATWFTLLNVNERDTGFGLDIDSTIGEGNELEMAKGTTNTFRGYCLRYPGGELAVCAASKGESKWVSKWICIIVCCLSHHLDFVSLQNGLEQGAIWPIA